jgi:hypothetical protein
VTSIWRRWASAWCGVGNAQVLAKLDRGIGELARVAYERAREPLPPPLAGEGKCVKAVQLGVGAARRLVSNETRSGVSISEGTLHMRDMAFYSLFCARRTFDTRNLAASRTPLPASRFPHPASRTPLPASRFPQAASRTPLPASRSPRPASRTPLPASRSPRAAPRPPFPALRSPPAAT